MPAHATELLDVAGKLVQASVLLVGCGLAVLTY